MSSDFREWIAALVTPRETSSGPRPEELRASDADRERVITVLTEAAADGRLSRLEHEERVDAAYRSLTLGQLMVLTRDLLPPDQQPIALHSRPVAAVFRNESRGGRWVVPSTVPVSSIGGKVELDLREALLQSRRIVVQLAVVAGTVNMTVPEGVRIVVAPNARIGQFKDQTRPPADPDCPVIELAGYVWGGRVIAKSPKPPKKGRRR
ncbi:DUF1707 domain-containing protein [Herbidospora galbida]|uniref:DUF1707 domain-containing protein n=1 Tax=Herbidospora galbida TaxID=2575442 RepID=A0A4U3LWT9_9ACTN|nr:DUF1707 domain-containing protein [Herbidospora galbida]TKK80685.1 DUF1707 domain-containing protein [Herbidospora galbida]